MKKHISLQIRIVIDQTKKRCHQFTWSLVQKSTSKSCILPGGGFNPFEKYVQMKIGILPQIGVINKKHSKPPPSISLHHHMNHMPPVFPTTHLSPPSTTHTLGAWPIGQIWVASPLSLVSARTEAAAQLPGWDHRSADGRKYVERVWYIIYSNPQYKSLACVFTFPHTRPTKSAGLPESAEKKKTPARVFPIKYGQRYRRALYSDSCLRMASCSQDFGQTCATQEHR